MKPFHSWGTSFSSLKNVSRFFCASFLPMRKFQINRNSRCSHDSEENGVMIVSKAIARTGFSHRKDVEQLIREGRILVSVNGQPAGFYSRVNPWIDSIRVNGQELPRPPQSLLYMVNKPRGCVTASRFRIHHKKKFLKICQKIF